MSLGTDDAQCPCRIAPEHTVLQLSRWRAESQDCFFVVSNSTFSMLSRLWPHSVLSAKGAHARAAQHALHSDTLTHDSHVQAPAPPHSLLNIQQRTLPPINIKQCAPT